MIDSASSPRSPEFSPDKRQKSDKVGGEAGRVTRRFAVISNAPAQQPFVSCVFCVCVFLPFHSHPHVERTDSPPKKKQKKISHSCNTYCKCPQTEHPTCGYITSGSPTPDIMIYKYSEKMPCYFLCSYKKECRIFPGGFFCFFCKKKKKEKLGYLCKRLFTQ